MLVKEDNYSGDSRADIADFIWWAEKYEVLHRSTDWDETDYMLTVEAYAENIINGEIAKD